jgi:hypothetical protein
MGTSLMLLPSRMGSTTGHWVHESAARLEDSFVESGAVAHRKLTVVDRLRDGGHHGHVVNVAAVEDGVLDGSRTLWLDCLDAWGLRHSLSVSQGRFPSGEPLDAAGMRLFAWYSIRGIRLEDVFGICLYVVV